jgi:thioredoxin reductase (NADPH)
MAAKVTVIHRRDEFKASKAMATRVLNHPNIDILWNTRVNEFISNHHELAMLHQSNSGGGGGGVLSPLSESGGGSIDMEEDEEKLEYLLLEEDQVLEYMDEATGMISHENTTREILFKVDGVFVAIGHVPNTQLFDDDPMLRRDAEGYVYTIPGSTVTSVTGVYAAGDGETMCVRESVCMRERESVIY